MKYAFLALVLLIAVCAWGRAPVYRRNPPHYPNPTPSPMVPFPFLEGTNCTSFCVDCHTA